MKYIYVYTVYTWHTVYLYIHGIYLYIMFTYIAISKLKITHGGEKAALLKYKATGCGSQAIIQHI